nr:reverse transcriptase domain-containing protein [Tanacetum cinerariifolium]
STSVGIKAEVPVKMPPRRNRPLTEAYEQEFKQRVMARMEEQLDQVSVSSPGPTDSKLGLRRTPWDRNGRGSKGEESENPFFEVAVHLLMKNRIDQGKGFIDWFVSIKEVFEFKEVPENKRVSLIATKLRGRASVCWKQLKLIKESVGKPRVTSWRKKKKLLREKFIPHKYQRLMYQQLKNLKQGTKSVKDYTTEVYQLIARNDLQKNTYNQENSNNR